MTTSSRRLRPATGLFALALILVATGWHKPASRALFSPQGTRQRPTIRLSGAAAKDFLDQPGEGQTLLAALNSARFQLKKEKHGPFNEKSGAGYLGTSHHQNLTAWFNNDGATLGPIVPAAERSHSWQLHFQLKAYGYGRHLVGVPPIASYKVAGTRIEYERSFNRQAKVENRELTEWYENRTEGIEQGFTVTDPPEKRSDVSAREPLRLVMSVRGNLRAEAKDNGLRVELSDKEGRGALSYSKLVAQDAKGKQLAARMEASKDGREIALVVEDEGAPYPIVIDPVVASLETKLAASTSELDARFGTAVAIDGDTAVVGAWRDDINSQADAGAIYVFSRSGSTWILTDGAQGTNANDQCGWSVAINGTKIVYGCPGVDFDEGQAFLYDVSSGQTKEFIPGPGYRYQGDRFGTSVTIDGATAVVGSPNYLGWGAVSLFDATSAAYKFGLGSVGAGSLLGTSVAIKGDTLIAGAPGKDSSSGGTTVVDAGVAVVYTLKTSQYDVQSVQIAANDAAAGDNFGNSVALSGNTAVIGAWGNDQKATDAGAAYVFVRDANGNWSQQQKLTASDGQAYDYFSNNAVAIQANTIVVGAYAWEPFTLNGTTDYGKAYVFMRSGTTWSEQTTMLGDNNPSDQFGISVGISNDTVIAGARAATASNVARAGAAYVYRLECVPPYNIDARVGTGLGETPTSSKNVCPGTPGLIFRVSSYSGSTSSPSFQWRKDGVNIAGATSATYGINKAITAAEAGTYDVVITNGCGSDTSNPVIVTVYTFGLSPTSGNFGAGGSKGVLVNVTSPGNCSYTATSNAAWIVIKSGANGTAPGTVSFDVDATTASTQRSGTITIGDKTFTVTQDGLNCSYAINPISQNVGAKGETVNVNVTVTAGCTWAASSNSPFISINSGTAGTGNGTVSYTVAPNPDPSARSGTLTVAGQTVTVMQDAAALLANISTRLLVLTGDNALIGGFIVTGTQPKRVMIRAIGPSLPLNGKLTDPQLQLFNSAGQEIAFNNNWRDATNRQEIIDSTIPPTDELESAVLTTLDANNSGYTAVVRGAGDSTGVGVVEVYDLGRGVDSKLANISTRGLVQTADNVLIAGTIVIGSSQKVIIRAIGPSLSIAGKMEDPTLELRDANGGLLEANDNWIDSPNKQAIIDSTIPPSNDLESAIVRALSPAAYTAIVRGVSDSTGIAVVEVYALN